VLLLSITRRLPLKIILQIQQCTIIFARRQASSFNTYQERQRDMARWSLGNPYKLLTCMKVPTPAIRLRRMER